MVKCGIRRDTRAMNRTMFMIGMMFMIMNGLWEGRCALSLKDSEGPAVLESSVRGEAGW